MKINKKTFLILIIAIIVIVAILFFIFYKKDTGTIFNSGKVVDNETTSPFLPNGATIINKDLNTGIVIKDKNNNEWVWIEVPKTVTAKANTDKEIEEALENYVKVDSTGKGELISNKQGHTDAYHEGIGLTKEQYNIKKSEILKSIKENGGFYIGRYETGHIVSEGETSRLSSGKTIQVPVIQKDAYPYIYVTNEQAEKLSESFSTEDTKCSLMLGIQYDLVFKYFNVKGKITPKELTQDSTKIGNYSNNKDLNITSTNVKKLGLTKTSWETVPVGKLDIKEEPALLTTGASDDAKILNLYDIAGNIFEWTLEKGLDKNNPCAYIGGSYRDMGSGTPCSKRVATTKTESRDYIGFRATMY